MAGFALAACADAPTAAPAASAEPSPSTALAPAGPRGYMAGITVRVPVYPTQPLTLNMGTHKLVIPAGAICDLATSGYGPTMWNAPCTPSKVPVTIIAKYYTNGLGRAEVDFAPALRFVPSKTVTLYLTDKAASTTATSKIWYCATPTSTCIDESLTDPSLVSSRDPNTGYIFRRIKHFSGYNVTFGRSGGGQ